MRHIRNIFKTSVTAELVALAAEHTGVPFKFEEFIGPVVVKPPRYLVSGQFDRERYQRDHGSIWGPEQRGPNEDLFWNEFERLKGIILKPLDEPILADDYPVHPGYLYVKNGRMVELLDNVRTVGQWKQLEIPDVEKAVEIRRCDMVGRMLRLPPKKEEPKLQIPSGWNASGRHLHQKKRRPRCSNKIRKVK